MDLATCYKCGCDNKELRPYGVGGAPVCFTCAMSQESITTAQFTMQLDSALEHSNNNAATLTPIGPAPFGSPTKLH